MQREFLRRKWNNTRDPILALARERAKSIERRSTLSLVGEVMAEFILRDGRPSTEVADWLEGLFPGEPGMKSVARITNAMLIAVAEERRTQAALQLIRDRERSK
jgi:hypothetical protein